MKFSKDIVLKLEEFGWSPQRKIDTTDIIKSLIQEGYKLNKYALKIIEQFGNLEFKQPAFKKEGETEKLHFNSLRASDHIYREKVEEYEIRVGDYLVVIGEAYNEHLILMVSDKGVVYGGYDEYLTLLGSSFEAAIEALFYSKETKEIN
jgi:hypothetical protein